MGVAMHSGFADECFLEALYEPALFEGDWVPALEWLRARLNAAEATLCTTSAGYRMQRFDTTGNLHTPEVRRQIAEHYLDMDPKKPIFANCSPGFLFNDARHFDKEFISGDPFYQECVLPLGTRHTLDLFLDRRSQDRIFLAAMRPQRMFDEADEQIIHAIGRHFRRVVRLRQQITEAESRARLVAASLDQLTCGVIVLDENGKIAHANVRARNHFAYGELRTRHSCLLAPDANSDGRLQLLLRAVLTGTTPAGAVKLADCERSLVVWAVRLPATSVLTELEWPGVLIIVRDPCSRIGFEAHDLEILHGLTPAEARLAIAIANGETLKSYSAKRRVALSTARTQLHWVLQKVGASSQAELVRMLISLSSLASHSRT